MRLVESMSARWGVLPSDHGKMVWFELPAQGSQEQAWDDDGEADIDAEVLLASFPDDHDELDLPEEAPRVLGWAA
jgi:hypothetical protein